MVVFLNPSPCGLPASFNKDAEMISIKNSTNYPNLADLLKQNPKIKPKCFKVSLHDSTIAYLVIIQCHHDTTLMKLAKDCNFPRGFPILYIPGKSIQIYGFYPKFDNDERAKKVEKSVFKDATSVSGSLKYSGFLGGVLPFLWDGKVYVIFTSKNDADTTSKFVQDVKRIFLSTSGALESIVSLATDGNYLFGEVLSKLDQQHGYAISNEAFVVTCFGKSNNYNLTSSTPIIHPNNFSTFADFATTDAFCMKFGLSRDGHFFANADNVAVLMNALERARDSMTLPMFFEIIKTHANWITGTIQHSDYIEGLILEGLVMKVTMADGTTKTVKYKFAIYTIRTMLYRTILASRAFPTDAIESFVDTWCLTDIGRDFWSQIARAFFVAERQNRFEYPIDCPIGKHIFIADKLSELSSDAIAALSAEYDTVFKVPVVPIIVVVGPVGFGKSTCADFIHRQLGEKFPRVKFVNVDGDVLNMDLEEVKKLGSDRASYTISLLIDAIAHGKVPIISTGGGALYGPRDSSLTSIVWKMLGVELEMHLFLPSFDISEIQLTSVDDIMSTLNALYTSAVTMQAVIKSITDRVARGDPSWSLSENFPNVATFAKSIAKRTSNNFQFVGPLVKSASFLYRFPVITSDNRTQTFQLPADFHMVSPIDLQTASVSQVRALASISNEGTLMHMGHSTLIYSRDPIPMQVSAIDTETANLPKGPISGTIATFTSVDGTGSTIQVAFPNDPKQGLHQDGTTHFTIAPGQHAPAQMKNVVAAMRHGDATISLPINFGSSAIEYSLVPTTTVSVSIVFHSMFYL